MPGAKSWALKGSGGQEQLGEIKACRSHSRKSQSLGTSGLVETLFPLDFGSWSPLDYVCLPHWKAGLKFKMLPQDITDAWREVIWIKGIAFS